jgi:hypothetical protein
MAAPMSQGSSVRAVTANGPDEQTEKAKKNVNMITAAENSTGAPSL